MVSYDEIVGKSTIINHIIMVIIVLFIVLITMLVIVRKALPLLLRIRSAGLRIAHKSKAEGVIAGRLIGPYVLYSPYCKEGHVTVIGGSGSGKSSACCIPSLISLCHAGNASDAAPHFFALDISGDIIFNVDPNETSSIVFSPLSHTSNVTFDVFSTLRRLDDMGLRDEVDEGLADLSLILLPKRSTGDNSKWFEDGGRDILKASLIAYFHQGLSFPEICDKVLSLDYVSLFTEIDKLDPYAAKFISQFQGMSEKNIAGCKQSATAAIQLFATPILTKALTPSYGSLTAESIETSNIFIEIPEHQLEKYAPLMELITNSLLFYLSQRPLSNRRKIFLFIDEYASFKTLDLSAPLQKLRKRNCRIVVLFQSVAQLDRNFGNDARREMMDNFEINIIFGVSDPDTAEYFSKKIGMHKKRRRTFQPYHILHSSETEYDEYAYKPTDFARLKRHVICISKGESFLLLKNFYFK